MNQIKLNGSRKSDSRFSYSTEYGITIIVIKCILAVLTIDVMLLIYLLASWYVVCIKEGNDLDM